MLHNIAQTAAAATVGNVPVTFAPAADNPWVRRRGRQIGERQLPGIKLCEAALLCMQTSITQNSLSSHLLLGNNVLLDVWWHHLIPGGAAIHHNGASSMGQNTIHALSKCNSLQLFWSDPHTASKAHTNSTIPSHIHLTCSCWRATRRLWSVFRRASKHQCEHCIIIASSFWLGCAEMTGNISWPCHPSRHTLKICRLRTHARWSRHTQTHTDTHSHVVAHTRCGTHSVWHTHVVAHTTAWTLTFVAAEGNGHSKPRMLTFQEPCYSLLGPWSCRGGC
jgi:hypothetical protein